MEKWFDEKILNVACMTYSLASLCLTAQIIYLFLLLVILHHYLQNFQFSIMCCNWKDEIVLASKLKWNRKRWGARLKVKCRKRRISEKNWASGVTLTRSHIYAYATESAESGERQSEKDTWNEEKEMRKERSQSYLQYAVPNALHLWKIN